MNKAMTVVEYFLHIGSFGLKKPFCLFFREKELHLHLCG